jgi:ribosomal protein L19
MELNLDTQASAAKKVIIGGVAYNVAPLKIKDQLEMQTSLKDKDQQGQEYFHGVIAAIAKCGVPESILMDMNSDQLKAYIEFVAGSSEKK